jgi:hypothetical protein
LFHISNLIGWLDPYPDDRRSPTGSARQLIEDVCSGATLLDQRELTTHQLITTLARIKLLDHRSG